MSRRFYLTLVGSIGIFYLSACGEKAADEVQNASSAAVSTGQYFDVAGFIRWQIALLQKENPVTIKTVAENDGSAETKKVKNLNWQEELGTFLELDINKPAYRNAYTSSRQQDANTGLTTITYRKKPGTDGNVVYVAITADANGQVRAIEGLQESNNMLIQSRRKLELNTNTKNGLTRVNSYSIQGLQKPILFGPLRYVVKASIESQ